MTAPVVASAKSTLAFGSPVMGVTVPSVTASTASESIEIPVTVDLAEEPEVLGETLWASASPQTLAQYVKATSAAAARTTVLPRRRAKDAGAPSVIESRPRFDRVKVLGQGGMGEVALVRDNDIRRTVAVKYLRSENASDEAALLRFADEIRVVGQLEHPAIVPVYDVGVDDQGQHFLVMKHLHGRTMEDIIEKLREGDPETTKRFTFEHRAHCFLQVLDAMRYAHSRGVIHRDLKPANIMIGPFGEVTVMDWGIAKPIGRKDPAATDVAIHESHGGRLLETQVGALAGTPLYMSPEQAAGRNDELDERSDVYALSVVYYEWLTLTHPLEGKSTLMEILGSIALSDYDHRALGMRGVHAGVPMEQMNVALGGLHRDPSKRHQSIADMEKRLTDALEGHFGVSCHMTFAKQSARSFAHWIDRHPMLYTGLFFGGAATMLIGLLGGIAYGVMRAIG
jgi:serine/threonine-protein kinase